MATLRPRCSTERRAAGGAARRADTAADHRPPRRLGAWRRRTRWRRCGRPRRSAATGSRSTSGARPTAGSCSSTTPASAGAGRAPGAPPGTGRMQVGQAPLLTDVLAAAGRADPGRRRAQGGRLRRGSDGTVISAAAGTRPVRDHLVPASRPGPGQGATCPAGPHRPARRAPRGAAGPGRRLREARADFLAPHVTLVRDRDPRVGGAAQASHHGCGRSTTRRTLQTLRATRVGDRAHH